MRTFPRYLISLVLALLIAYILFENWKIEPTEDEKVEAFEEKPQSCGKFLNDSDIVMENVIWQVFRMNSNVSMKLLGAYFDDRENKSLVRVSSIGSHLNILYDVIYCQFWFDEESQPVVVKAEAYDYIWYKKWWAGENAIGKKDSAPIFIECPLTTSEIPKSVSITANPCDSALNNLKIVDNKPEDGVKKKFGVCTKFIYYDEREAAIKFIEWVKLLQILGVEKVHAYNKGVHPDFQQVLDKLEELGDIEVRPYMDPKETSPLKYYSLQLIIVEMLMLNDCFYRNRNLYEFIAFLDPDEVIMTKKPEDKTWTDLLKNFEPYDRNMINAFVFENLFFPPNNATPFENIPKYHYMLQNNQRLSSFEKNPTHKSIIVPDNVFVVAQHSAMHCFSQNHKCNKLSIPRNISQMNHYRDKIDGLEVAKTIEDKTLEKYQKELVDAVNKTLQEVDFTP